MTVTAINILKDVRAETERVLRYIEFGDFLEGIKPRDPEFQAEMSLKKIDTWIKLLEVEKQKDKNNGPH